MFRKWEKKGCFGDAMYKSASMSKDKSEEERYEEWYKAVCWNGYIGESKSTDYMDILTDYENMLDEVSTPEEIEEAEEVKCPAVAKVNKTSNTSNDSDVSTCLHEERYVNSAGGIMFWVCKDCGADLGDFIGEKQ